MRKWPLHSGVSLESVEPLKQSWGKFFPPRPIEMPEMGSLKGGRAPSQFEVVGAESVQV